MANPTAAELKARYPAFAGISDQIVTASIGEAARFVNGDQWVEDDIPYAIINLAAHYLVTEDAANDGAASKKARQVISEGLGDARVTYSQEMGGTGDLNSTIYGRRFMRVQKANLAGGVAV